ncbi:threonine synthase [Pseudoramibacter faecis]|uniref:threonine synthase n=1 Tax=Pseudoramibacter faecis TaxID=3108534 RepID=UPI002E782A5A|nr:threonine synthase [Pseudoramibacter sp. HA2172]
MNQKYISTRGGQQNISASQAIISGLATDGGLFVPSFIHEKSIDLPAIINMNYGDLACKIFNLFLNDFSENQIRHCVTQAYETGLFEGYAPAAVQRAADRYFLELYHGPTCAFKDMALTILPHFMTTAMNIQHINREVVILTATSGDTGKAALSGFADVPGIDIIVYYPKDGVSTIQEKQMLTQTGKNTYVVGVDGNFDDTQNGVKRIFSDPAFNRALQAKGFQLSSANSINIGRLLPQVIYYFYSYGELIKRGAIALGDAVNFVVPTGNFGDILAGYYASLIGLPVGRLICASNANRVLTDFFQTGDYNRNRPFYKTMSPSMDILISSNFERLLYDLSGDTDFVAGQMQALNADGAYTVPQAMRDKIDARFWGGCSDEKATASAIKAMFRDHGYLMDPHTAVASQVYDDYRAATGDTTPTVVLSTASPYKFAHHVYESIFGRIPADMNDFAVLDALADQTGVPVPAPLADLESRPNQYDHICAKADMPDALSSFLSRLSENA